MRAYLSIGSVALSCLLAACGGGGSGGTAIDPDPSARPAPTVEGNLVQVDETGTALLSLMLGEQLDDFVAFDAIQGQARLNAIGAPLFRIHAGADSQILPEPGRVAGNPAWDFSAMDRLVDIAYRAGSRVLMNVRHAPVSLSTCRGFHSAAGTLKDPSFGQFATYMANLVAYYNLGQFTDASGVHVNPAGSSHRVDDWEIWNEPELPYEFPCLRPDGQPSLSVSEFATMWAAATEAMAAVDPTIRFVGPSVSDPRDTRYLDAIKGVGRPLDAVSVHGYAGPNTATDSQLLLGGGDALGIAGIVSALTSLSAVLDARGMGSVPLFLDEFNISPDGEDDPNARGWSNFSAAAGGAAFIRMAKLSATRPLAFVPFQFVEAGGKRLSALDSSSGAPFFPYWRDLLLKEALQPGDRALPVTSTSAALDVLALRSADGAHIRVLVANTGAAGTGSGLRGDDAVVTLDVRPASGQKPRAVSVQMVDAATAIATGPNRVSADARQPPVLRFNGYGLALVDFSY